MALTIAAEEGAGAVSMSRVASRLGVAMPSLYYYVENLDELLSLVAAELLREMPLPNPRLRWDRWLTEFAQTMRSLLLEQPILTRLSYLSVHPPFRPQVLEQALRVLTKAGFSAEYALAIVGQHIRLVVDLVHAEHALAKERQNGRNPVSELRRSAKTATPEEIPLLLGVLEGYAHLPEDIGDYSEVLFEWVMSVQMAGLAAVLEGRVPWTLLGPPRHPELD